MPLRSLDQLDDATFDVTAARAVDDQLILRGSVVEHDTSAGTVRLPVTLTVSDAVDVLVDSAGGTGELVLESIDVTATAVTLRGVVPCEVVVTTSRRARVLLEVGETPIAVRRRWRWWPWIGSAPVILDHRAVSKRLRRTACPACRHPWAEHPGSGNVESATCSECAYEHEHGELPPGRSICAARVSRHLIEPGCPPD